VIQSEWSSREYTRRIVKQASSELSDPANIRST
jgi:hypothetical protein